MAVFGEKTRTGGKIFCTFYFEFPQKHDIIQFVWRSRACSLTFCNGKGAGERKRKKDKE
jgi:hypothetical protein